MNNREFFNFSGKQIVNQWLCITLVCLMCFWTVLYYVVNQAQDIGDYLVAGNTVMSAIK